MYRCIVSLFLLFIIETPINATPPENFTYSSFGLLTIYRPESIPNSVVLFISGDGGWNKGEIDMANSIVKLGALVVGIDYKNYLKNIRGYKSKCFYPAADFEQLSFAIQKKYRIKQYLKPVLVGYSAGASLAFGILAQAPDNTFKGAISLGFCPEIDINKPLCNGKALRQHVIKEGETYGLEACEKLSAPFIVLHGVIDQVCSHDETKRFMQSLQWGELISLPNVGHSFSNEKNWLPQFIESYKKVMIAPSFVNQKADQNVLLQSLGLNSLPGDFLVTVIPSASNDTLSMVFMISGDGGWTSFDQSLSESIASKGIPVIGLDAQQYFWNVKTPEETATDISKVIEFYLQQLKKSSFILVGYSFGASIVPFIANRISDPLKSELKGVFSLSPDEKCDFEIHVSDMLSLEISSDKYNVLSEIRSIKKIRPICVFGQEEDEVIRNHFAETEAKVFLLPGNHHYNDDFNRIAELIYSNTK